MLIAASLASSPTAGVADACIGSPVSSDDTGPTLVSVASTLGVEQPRDDCGTDTVFHSFANACQAPPFVGSVPGAYCGGMVAASATTRCMWAPVLNGVETKLYVGFDLNADGHITMGAGETVVGPMDPAPAQYIVTNQASQSGRTIAFPTNVESQEQRPSDESLVGCL